MQIFINKEAYLKKILLFSESSNLCQKLCQGPIKLNILQEQNMPLKVKLFQKLYLTTNLLVLVNLKPIFGFMLKIVPSLPVVLQVELC